ncbi:TrmB family transcriptional regulator [Halobacillus mangrovi]|uniref:TrmB family transcriptional regulator n=1 Tax=Halobacillus mangrovi TaxID=402384 RepID=A0A1W5ZTL0_9BACI|nr:helix-turn-helix domain-containing protein [Halobacillus mangrovi]ARI76644.1 TrmB family transcriptional regulator [Halobacillus mangrovi]
MLQKFGFTQYESQVFEVLTASTSPLDATTIVKYSQVPKSKVYEVLNRLADKGLILSSFTDRKKLYTALPLETIIEKLTDEFQTNVEELKSKKYSLTPVDDRVWTIKNNKAISSLTKQTLSKASRSIYFSGWSDDLLTILPVLEEKQENGLEVEVMSIGEIDTILENTHTLLPDERHEALERYQLMIADEKELVFAGVEHGEWQGIQTLSSPLVKFFTEFFFHDVALAEITHKYEDTLMKDEKIKNILMKLRY